MRRLDSHKGENGSVAVIGGSKHQHGAPLFSALAAEAAGVDLVYVWVPETHVDVSKTQSLNFQVSSFGDSSSDEIGSKDRSRILEFLATIDVAVIGPGLSRTPSALRSMMELLEEAPCPVVCDASALQPGTLEAVSGRGAILTPHLGELERMGITLEELSSLSREHRCTFLAKGVADMIVNEKGEITTVKGGNPGLTVGGTGDALAGLVAGLVAQGMGHADACALASTAVKQSGDLLLPDFGYAYTTAHIIRILPKFLRAHLT
jgi:NAD(P)H-hydrate epimerase